jgi:uncharacterized protein YecA (UPF0149 family)
MDTRTGLIAPQTEILKALADNYPDAAQARQAFDRYFKPIDIENLSPGHREEYERTGRTKIGRNDPCPCGSRKKFKRCCIFKPSNKQ